MTIKLMSWNVAKRTKKLPQQLEKIGAVGIDILALQEVTSRAIEGFRKELEKIGLEHVEINTSGDSHLIVASQWQVERISPPPVPREESALSAIIKSPCGGIELHTVHVPNASENGRKTKVDTFDAIYKALAKKSEGHRILCGDFNSPKEERCNGKVIYFGKTKEHQRSEEQVLSGLAEYNLADTYIKLCGYARIKHNGYEGPQYSHVNNNPRTPRRRFDHIFSSSSLNPQKCGYLHHERGDLSDHSPVYAVYKPKLPRLRIKKKR